MSQIRQNEKAPFKETNDVINQKTKKLGLYQKTVAIRTAVAAIMVPCGHILLEPIGVPHGTAENISLAAAGILFTPEIALLGIRMTINDIQQKVKKIQK